MILKLNAEQIGIMEHTSTRAPNRMFCGGGKDMDALVKAGLMESAGRKSFVPDEYFSLTVAGREFLWARERISDWTAIQVIRDLVGGIDAWARDTDGVHDELWDVYRVAKAITGVYVSDDHDSDK